MLDAQALVRNYKGKGVLVDANLLVLLIVGRVNRGRITAFKRTASFVVKDFELMERLIVHFRRVVTTPHLLSQTSDLTDLAGKELVFARNSLRNLIELMEESHEPAKTLVASRMFQRFGLADSGVAAVAARGILPLTSDYPLHETLQLQGIDSLNFNHLRAPNWR